MITPAFSPTATERVLPRLALDFTTASLDPRVTVTRALNTATRINSSGLIETVNANLPRFDYTLNTGGACKGLLIEETRTNSILYSADISNAVWATVYGSFTLTGSQTDPSGGTTATILTGAGGFAQLITGLSANTTYTYSFYAKSVSGTPSYRVVSGGGTNLVARTSYAGQINANTWTRVSVTYTTGAADTSVRVYPMDIGSTSAVVLAFHQNEAGAFATSYIPTTTTSVTRNADVVDMTGTNFSSWFNGGQGAFMAQWVQGPVNTASIQTVMECAGSIRSPQTTNGIRYYAFPDAGNVLLSASAVSNTIYKAVFSYKTATATRAALNGGAVQTNSSNYSTVPTQLSLGRLGSSTNFWLNSCVQKLMYWPQSLTSPEVQAFSK